MFPFYWMISSKVKKYFNETGRMNKIRFAIPLFFLHLCFRNCISNENINAFQYRKDKESKAIPINTAHSLLSVFIGYG
jgi:hypothetical protein